MISRLAGAVLRAIFVVLLIATPTLLLPAQSPDTAQIVTLVALFAGGLVLFEYASAYPSLIEFRDAPPFNRVRFFSLFATVFLLTILLRGRTDPTTLTQFVAAVGGLIGYAIDFPYSPVRLVLTMFPEGTDGESLTLVRTATGISYLISLISLSIFAIMLRLQGWPLRGRSFNVWINLPTFDPTAGGDVVQRLIRDARFNIFLGFVLPFLTPLAVKSATVLFEPLSDYSSQTLIWTVAAWAFLPASLFMRGIAMGRIADMIHEQRRQSYELAVANGLAPA
ncbi:MAG: hypothetical protein ACC631_02495 [Halocynthiibacter sp.]